MDPYLISSIVFIESGFDKEAVSIKGAVGLMQNLPKKESDWDKHKNPEFSLDVGILHFKFLLDEFKGNLLIALAAYNCGLNCVKKREKLPRETLFFIQKVIECYYYLWLNTPNICFPFNCGKE